ncbi:hypothetical protein LOTGIDRAFT_232734 [Lottia gigantea]|uniref:Insulin-like domain-containing protein n=1 Tax=Lottia gigantea TaxID=225164 RepID=V4BW71_LOTGI|nr:hypothetical protein LOTGIDRAFT_232734 [Lottia gigantea]ESO93309.1 hypothetical protein LOTGIDRAFT_232734 [Lottia gigantea]
MAESVMWKLLLSLCILVGTPVFAGYERSCNLERQQEDPRGLCGSQLESILHNVCFYLNKRASPKVGPERVKKRMDQSIKLDKFSALSFLVKRGDGFGNTGITCECCLNRCNLIELSSYCIL